MPLSHRKLSLWYGQLAQQLEAGLPFADALRSTRGTGAPSEGLDTMALLIESGGSIDDALSAAGGWLPFADRLFLSAAAETGRMPRVLRNLSARYTRLGAAGFRFIFASAYPVAVLHIGLLIFPVLRMIDWEKGFRWDTGSYASALAFTVLPIWAMGVTVWILIRRQNPFLARIVNSLPALGRYARAQATADFSFALGNFLEAGTPLSQAWPAAGLVSRSPELKAAAQAMEVLIGRGEAPGKSLAAWPCFPADFVALYRTGEATGRLEENLFRLTNDYQEQAGRALKVSIILYPSLLFLAVAGVIVYHVFSFYAGYFGMIEKLAQ